MISLCFQNAEGSKHVTVRGHVEFSDHPELIRRSGTPRGLETAWDPSVGSRLLWTAMGIT